MRKYVILRNDAPVARGSRDAGLFSMMSAEREPVTFERLTENAAASMALEPEVEAVVPVMATHLVEPFDGSAGDMGDVWGLDAVGARTCRRTGAGVTVAVLDTGIDAAHPAFQGMSLEQQDFTGDGDGDRQGHGTHCAGTIFGRDVDGVRIGVAPGVSRGLIGKVLGDAGRGDTQMMVEGVQWALGKGADIVSMSLGFDFPRMVAESVGEGWPVDLATSRGLEAYRLNLRLFDALMNLTKARGAFGSGSLVVAAAGNASRRHEDSAFKIAASLPSAADGVLSVAAVGRDGENLRVADFSNSQALVSAPGVDILSAKVGGGLKSLSGTSMACPHVAGLAALWWEEIKATGGRSTAMKVENKLRATATRGVFGSTGLEEDIGEGLVLAP